jgi:hypothetical protein
MRLMMMIALGVAVLTAFAAQTPGNASSADDAPSAQPWVVKNPDDFHWKVKDTLPQTPSPAHSAVAWGDPAKGPFAFFGKFPAGFTVPMHWHTNEVLVVMTKNSMVITPEGEAPREIKEGGFFSLPAKMKYVAQCAQECMFLAWGDKPFDIYYKNPKDDPRNTAAVTGH